MILCEPDTCDICRGGDVACGKARELRDDWEHYASQFTD